MLVLVLISFFVCFIFFLMVVKWRGVFLCLFFLCIFLFFGVFLIEGIEGWGEVGLDDEFRINENIRYEFIWLILYI